MTTAARTTGTNLPAWLVSELVDRGHEVVTRSETLAEMHARIEAEQGQVWNAGTRRWEDR